MAKILDCTLRDGGYYTNWDFDNETVEAYIKSMDMLPIDYIELGYRSNPSKIYLGEYGHCPAYKLSQILSKTKKKIAIMLNQRDVKTNDLPTLLNPIMGLVHMVRMAVDPRNIKDAINLAREIKKLNFEVGFNIMYMSKWTEYNLYTDTLKEINEVADLFCMVDSFGSMTPHDVKSTIKEIKNYITIPIGFHAHNNLELALSNTIVAIEQGIDIIDSTVLGMGRGAGNLKTELLLTYLNKVQDMKVDFNTLGDVVQAFHPLLERCKWGTNLPYMISGANSFPQKEVMEWVSNRTYSFNNIVRALDNKKEHVHDNKKFPNLEHVHHQSVLIIGGGETAIKHLEGIIAFLKSNPECIIIHSTTRNSLQYQQLDIPQYFCLVGSESERMKKVFKEDIEIQGKCILPPYPRKMGTDVPSFMEDQTFQLEEINFTDVYKDSCTALALQLALFFKAEKVFITGYDGYPNGLSEKEADLSKENEYLIRSFINQCSIPLVSITPTLYNDLEVESLYQNI